MSGNKQRRFMDEFKRKAVRLTRRTKSLTAICGGISTNIWTCSRDKTPDTIWTPNSLCTRAGKSFVSAPATRHPAPCSDTS